MTRRALAGSVMSILGVTSMVEPCLAGVIPVSSCEDAGQGSLRAAAAAVGPSGDTLEISLPPTCNSTITLTSGQVTIPYTAAITTSGGRVRIDTSAPGRIFYAKSSLALTSLDISGGSLYYAPGSVLIADGGCVFADGDLMLTNTSITGCSSVAASFKSEGGGVYARGNLTLTDSTISGNTTGLELFGTSSELAAGGGASVNGTLTMVRSTISGNAAFGTSAGRAGGAEFSKGAKIYYSTVAGNAASYSFGGLYGSSSVADPLIIKNSTISGNSALQGFVGGIRNQGPSYFYSTTIAFNSAAKGKTGAAYLAAGLSVAVTQDLNLTLESTVIANNTYAGTPSDFGAPADGHNVTLSAANNLVVAPITPLPAGAGNLLGSSKCPLLGPLRDNGGPTQTHALLSHSPAIDAGNTDGLVTISSFYVDQRIAVRDAAADIGAYEIDKTDIVFNSGFDGCP